MANKAHLFFNKSLSQPIPYWLSPIGILLALAFWHGFNWKLSSDNWPFWLWFLDKVITLLSIGGAAWWAQNIFNDKAKIREDRERRLKITQNMLANTNQIDDLFHQFTLVSLKDGQDRFYGLASKFNEIQSWGRLYNFQDVIGPLDALQEFLGETGASVSNLRRDLINKSHSGRLELPIRQHLNRGDISKFDTAIKNLRNTIILTHNNIEAEH